jgi:hypothetical protein
VLKDIISSFNIVLKLKSFKDRVSVNHYQLVINCLSTYMGMETCSNIIHIKYVTYHLILHGTLPENMSSPPVSEFLVGLVFPNI